MRPGDKEAVIIDDDKHVLGLLKEATVMMGFHVSAFSCPVSALEHIKNGNADIILSDYKMPEMNGEALMKKIREFDKDIPVLMITAHGHDNGVRRALLEGGATDVLCKPININELFKKIKNVSGRNKMDDTANIPDRECTAKYIEELDEIVCGKPYSMFLFNEDLLSEEQRRKNCETGVCKGCKSLFEALDEMKPDA
jgi:DNA-binding response OmpR family regulator